MFVWVRCFFADGFLEDFCCMPKLPAPSTTTTQVDPTCLSRLPVSLGSPTSHTGRPRGRGREGGGRGGQGGMSHPVTADSGYRTEYQPGFEDPGGGSKHDGGHFAPKNILEMKKKNNVIISSGYHQHHHPLSPQLHSLPHQHQHQHQHQHPDQHSGEPQHRGVRGHVVSSRSTLDLHLHSNAQSTPAVSMLGRFL